MAGTWTSFGARKDTMNFQDLAIIEDDRMNPIIRLMFFGVSSLFILMSLRIGIIMLDIGDLSSLIIENIDRKVEAQLLFGFVCGFLERTFFIDMLKKSGKAK